MPVAFQFSVDIRAFHTVLQYTQHRIQYIYNANWKYVYKQQNSRIRVQASHSFKSIVFNIYCICAFLPTPKFSCNRYSTFSVVFGRNARSQAACLFDTPKNLIFSDKCNLVPYFRNILHCIVISYWVFSWINKEKQRTKFKYVVLKTEEKTIWVK